MQPSAFQFRFSGAPASCEPYGNGHINVTYRLVTEDGHAYILQKINRRVFRDVPALMRNVAAVTRHLAQKDCDPRRVLTLIPTADGRDYWVDEAGDPWRAYVFVERSLCLERADSPEVFAQSADAFGRFQWMLSDFPAKTLAETIPKFHDTPNRFLQLREAIAKDAAGRAASVRAEIDESLGYEAESGVLMDLLGRGELPLRVTHNDTKLNNVLFDMETRMPLCVVDLDTVMPGLCANDFGDSIRFGASTAAEDEKNLDLVRLSMPHYEAYARHFIGACQGSLRPLEIETLPYGALLMTLECGVRFLADHLNGDVYFHIARPEHNLDRARTQLKLAREMKANWRAMEKATK